MEGRELKLYDIIRGIDTGRIIREFNISKERERHLELEKENFVLKLRISGFEEAIVENKNLEEEHKQVMALIAEVEGEHDIEHRKLQTKCKELQQDIHTFLEYGKISQKKFEDEIANYKRQLDISGKKLKEVEDKYDSEHALRQESEREKIKLEEENNGIKKRISQYEEYAARPWYTRFFRFRAEDVGAVSQPSKASELEEVMPEKEKNYQEIKAHKKPSEAEEKRFLKAKKLYKKAKFYSENEQYKKAIKACEKAVELNPNYADAWHTLGDAYSGNRQYRKAIFPLKIAAKLKPNDARILYDLANAYKYEGIYQAAINAYEKAVELNPNYAPAWSGLEGAYQYNNQYPEAINACKKALELNPNRIYYQGRLEILERNWRIREDRSLEFLNSISEQSKVTQTPRTEQHQMQIH